MVMFISGLLEGIGIGVVIPLFEFFFQGREFVGHSPMSRFFYQAINTLHIPLSLHTIFGAVLVIFGVKSILKYLETVYINHLN